MDSGTEALVRQINHTFYERLNALHNMADMLLMGLDGELTPNVQHVVEQMRAELDLLTVRTRSLLEALPQALNDSQNLFHILDRAFPDELHGKSPRKLTN